MVFRKTDETKRKRSRAPSTRPAGGAAKKKDHAAEPFVIREVAPKDLDALFRLAGFLDSVNLPANKEVLRQKIKASRDSFSGRVENPLRREYLFVMEGLDTGTIAGTSMLFAQHGTHEAPHVYFDVLRDERYSVTLDRHFSHLCLRLGLNYRGPTEIGGLVLDPSLRSFGLGKQLSYVRFLFIAMYRGRFRNQVIAELMPPLLPDGRSELWEYLGRHFTGLTYKEADKLSQTNKEFITALFPQTPIYASLLPPEVQAKIGEVGEETRGVRRMLEAIGFYYSERIDPFDGGPHFEATTDEIALIKDARLRIVSDRPLPEGDLSDDPTTARVLLGVGDPDGPCQFHAMATRVRAHGSELDLSDRVKAALRVSRGSNVWTIPY
jgi:arginine N-succinyltransferase